MTRFAASVLLSLVALSAVSVAIGERKISDVKRFRSEASRFLGGDSSGNQADKRWAVLVAGSNGYENYRHQADVCHAYQLMKKGGLKDENVIVFMYDDIAFNKENPRPGMIINSPHGQDVYHGVPKDYTGKHVTARNLFAAILGNKSALTGGSRKVLDSGPNDNIFIYYTDHGASGILGMPTEDIIYAKDLIHVLKKKHASGTYKSMVFYVEACESGSIFEGLIPEGLNIYATTASNATENSYGTYCPGDHPSPPKEYDTCLGDLYSVAWLEDCDNHNWQEETLHRQYERVKKRTANDSHVMQYGDIHLSSEHISVYMGTNPAKGSYASADDKLLLPPPNAINQYDADVLHFWSKFRNAPEGSPRKFEAQKQLAEVMSHRVRIDNSVQMISKLLFGLEKGPEMLKTVRGAGQPLVDDWDCLKTMVRTYEKHCGSLSQYGKKHMRFFANICNSGIQEKMTEAASQACFTIPSGHWELNSWWL